MIIVERPLSKTEKQTIQGKTVLDLCHQAYHRKEEQERCFKWIDTAQAYTLNQQSYDTFFSLQHHSYWLYVRGRLFYGLFRHAQLLDALPQNFSFDSVQQVYALPSTESFWKHWSPQATIFCESSSKTSAPRIKTFLFFLKRTVTVGFKSKFKHKEGVLFSTSGYNLQQEKGLWDRQIGPLMDAFPHKNWQRLEAIPIPPKGLPMSLEKWVSFPRLHPTILSDAILLAYLLRHPWALLQLGVHVWQLKKRTVKTGAHTFNFGAENTQWQKYFTHLVRQVMPSIAMFHLWRKSFQWYLKKVAPHFVVAVSENNNIGRAFIEAAKSLNLPTFGIQHGSIDPHNIDYRFNKYEAKKAFPDSFFTWGEETRQYLIKQSHYPPDSTRAVGRLFSDVLTNTKPDATLLHFKEAQQKKLLFFASQAQGLFDENRVLSAQLLAQFCKENNLCCAIKLHPREINDGIYQKAFEAHQIPHALIIHSGDLYAMIHACDMGATCFSTVAWEIMGQQKPLVLFDPLQLDLLRLRQQPFVYFADNTTSFSTWMAQQEQHLDAAYALSQKKLGTQDGMVAQRIWTQIQQTLEGN